MATATMKVYPYLVLTQKGEFSHLSMSSGYQIPDKFHSDLQIFFISLPEIAIEVPMPGSEEMRQACARLLNDQMVDERAKFHARQTLMQSIRNDLLRLEAPDVLDAAPEAPERDLTRCMHCLRPKSQHTEIAGQFFCTGDPEDSTTFEEDDIPF